MTLFTVLFAIMVIGLLLGLAGQTWSQVMQREREEELFFRGDQYRRAIESYYTASPGGQGSYPRSLDDLLKDPRSPQIKRHLRKRYLDPFSNKEFELIGSGGNVKGETITAQSLGGIKGVRSTSSLVPFRQDGFAEEYEMFKGAPNYNKWEFVYMPKKAATPSQPVKLLPGTPGTPGTPGH
jgi:type II secretory pathway pseudopilin PulG